MKLVLTGANGQVGFELRRSLRVLGDVICLDRDMCDLSRPETLPRIVHDAKPDVLVNAAAYTAVDEAEREEELATLINGTAVGVLAKATRTCGALLIHYSTDYVFDGAKTEPYAEDDVPCPLNAYGRSKLAGEKAIAAAGGDFLILRTSWVYGARRSSFITRILQQARAGAELRVVADQIGAPTWSRDLADVTTRIVEAAAEERRRARFGSGLLHATASGATNWHGFAQAILQPDPADVQTSTTHVHPILSDEYATAATRPKNSRLSNQRLRDRFGLELPAWDLALARCMTELERVDAQA